ncbi:DsrE family protein [Swaminathania salitolerans]|uniref:DsrE family protein n=1 Tax=Swaminathania salitolerans TaxID=182838 RepID=UPI0011BD7AF6|nr:DsrE family protein [Swaminathania salitolerans]
MTAGIASQTGGGQTDGGQTGEVQTGRSLAILIAGPEYERAHHAFVLAAGALALGRRVILFGGGAGVLALCRDWSGLVGASHDETFRARGVAGLETLRLAVFELGGEVLACEAGLRAAGLDEEALCPEATLCGVTRFLERSADAQILSL